MTKELRVERCRRLPDNRAGRDFVVGDLHGHRSLLEQQLSHIGFDTARDRLFAVGDLIDRGPESLDTLALIEQPWFHTVLGNHELMLLNFLGFYESRLHARKSFSTGGGAWVQEVMARQRKRLMQLAEQAAALPLALHVDGVQPFNVMHGDLEPIGSCQERLLRQDTMSARKAELLVSSRENFSAALKSERRMRPYAGHAVQLSAQPLDGLPLTFVGHSPVRQIVVHRSYVYIDQGVCLRSAKRLDPTLPTVLEALDFADWLSSVTAWPAAASWTPSAERGDALRPTAAAPAWN